MRYLSIVAHVRTYMYRIRNPWNHGFGASNLITTLISAYYVYRSGSFCLTARVRSSTLTSLYRYRTRQPSGVVVLEVSLDGIVLRPSRLFVYLLETTAKRLHSFCISNRLTVALVSAVGYTTHCNTSVYFASSRPNTSVSTIIVVVPHPWLRRSLFIFRQ